MALQQDQEDTASSLAAMALQQWFHLCLCALMPCSSRLGIHPQEVGRIPVPGNTAEQDLQARIPLTKNTSSRLMSRLRESSTSCLITSTDPYQHWDLKALLGGKLKGIACRKDVAGIHACDNGPF